uniref:Uncharacterized protein n=2 Tax=Amphora coffeiformis TaxID=265554 RepID=A0A7S3L7W8_9STRA
MGNCMSLQPPPDKTDEGRYKTVSPITTTTTANLGSQVTLSSANRPTGSDILGITTSTSTGVVEHLVLQHCPIHKASMDAFRQAIPGPLQSLTIRQCCWADIETTIPALAAWIADETEIQSITLHSNSFKMSQYQPPQREWPAVHLNRLVTAIQPTTRVSLGPEFFTGTAGEQAMRVVCEACTSLHLCGDGLDPRGNNNDDNDSDVIHLQGLYQGLTIPNCPVQSLCLQGMELLHNDSSFTTLVNAVLVCPTLQHLEVSCGALRHASCETLVHLLQDDTHLVTLDLHQCIFLASLLVPQAERMGKALMHHTTLQVLRFRHIHLTDTLAIPLFTALQSNTMLRELDVTTCNLWDRWAPNTPTQQGYRALMQVLPGLSALQRLYLGTDFYFPHEHDSFYFDDTTTIQDDEHNSNDVVDDSYIHDMARAIYQNVSIIEYGGGNSTHGKRRYGPWSILIPACMERNKAIQIVERMLNLQPEQHEEWPRSVWQAAVEHMAQGSSMRQSALFRLLQRFLVDPSIHSDEG